MITINWLIVDLLASLPLYYLIWQYISKKALIEVSLVDLIYRDTIVYIYLLSSVLSSAIIQCLSNEENNQTLSYPGPVLQTISIATVYRKVWQFDI